MRLKKFDFPWSERNEGRGRATIGAARLIMNETIRMRLDDRRAQYVHAGGDETLQLTCK
jgi:hypothetical protein